MTDHAIPKRVRGQKDREAAYRQGFLDGVEYGVEELRRTKEVDAFRELALGAGLAKYRRTMTTEPKRRQRRKAIVAPTDGAHIFLSDESR